MASDDVERKQRERGKVAVTLVLVGLVVAFGALNLDEVRVNWILGTWRTPLIVVIVACLGIGIAIGGLAARRARR